MYEKINKKIAQANRRLSNMRKALGEDHSAIGFAEHSIRKAYGEDRSKYSPITGSESAAQIKRIERGADALLNSKYSTAKGRKQMHREQIDYLVEKLSTDKQSFSRRKAETIMDIFETKEWERIRSRSGSDGSGTDLDALQDMVNSKFSKEDIVNIMNDYIQSGKVKDFIQYSDRVQSIMGKSTKDSPISAIQASKALLDGEGDVVKALEILGLG